MTIFIATVNGTPWVYRSLAQALRTIDVWRHLLPEPPTITLVRKVLPRVLPV